MRLSLSVCVCSIVLVFLELLGTAHLLFEDVKVPLRNLIGMEGGGFKPIMQNFNHERFVLAAKASRFARVCVEESIKYARKRRTFGKRLIDHQVCFVFI